MKKIHTTYEVKLKNKDTVYITENNEVGDYLSIHSLEPCEGVLRHWGSKSALIAELKEIIKALEDF